MEVTVVNAFLDWLSVSYTMGSAANVGVPGGGHRWVPARGRWGYDVAHEDELTGMIRMSSSTRLDMGSSYVLSGSALAALASVMMYDDRIDACVHAGLDGGRASRVDLAVDISDGGEYARRVPALMTDGRLSHTVKSVRFIHGIEKGDGCTTYLGSRKTSKFLRIYDKNSESRGEVPTTRIEVQLGDHYAAQMWRTLTASDQRVRGGVIRSVLSGFVKDWADEKVNAIISGREVIQWGRPMEGADGTREWLATQVAPTFVREYRRMGGEAPTWRWFQRLVATMMKGEEVCDKASV
jgi:hypothetical protein